MERSLRTTLEISGGSLAIFLDRPLALALLAVPVVVVAMLIGNPARSRSFARATPNRGPSKNLQENPCYCAAAPAQPRLLPARQPGAGTEPSEAQRPAHRRLSGRRQHRRRRPYHLAAAAEKALGQTVTVVNKAGAGGQIGFTEFAAPPRRLHAGLSTCRASHHRARSRAQGCLHHGQLHPDREPGADPGLIWVKGDSPYKTLGDLLRGGQEAAGQDQRLHHRHLERRPSRHPDDAGGGKVEFRIVHFDGGARQLPASWAATSTSPSTMSAASPSASSRASCAVSR